MADPNPQEFCRLCLCCKLMHIESLQKNDILKKVSKYLLINMEYNSMGVCVNCYNSLQDFHNFYENVHSAEKNFHSITSLEAGHSQVKSTFTQTYNWNKKDTYSDFEESSNVILVDGGVICELVEAPEEEEEDTGKEVNQDLDESNSVNNQLNLNKKVKKEKLGKEEVTSEIEKKMMEFYNIKCEKCEDIKFKSFKMLSKHYSTVHKTQGYIKCCKRNIRVNDKSYLRSHMLKHLEPDSCRCTVCGKQLSSAMTLKNHMILHKPAEERPFKCSECDKRFCCKNDLRNHEKSVHIPENEREHFICDVCGKVFQRVANLRYHYSTVHLQERKYVCELCARCFTTPSGLRTHRNAAHNTKGPVQCYECNKWLKNEDTFHKHLQLHQNNSYPCSQCSKVCNSSTSLRSHMVKHSKERPYSCDICRKSFKTKTHLKNHSLQHSGGSNFKCQYCPKTFVNMSNYYTHKKRMHLNEDASKQGNKVNVKKEEFQLTHNVNGEISGNNWGCDYKVIRGDNGVVSLVRNEVSVVRQNIIVSPMNVKYTSK